MIFAAGIGKRLQPISQRTPKALVEVGGKPMLQRLIEKLILAGVTRIVVNIHHHPEKMQEFIEKLRYPGTEILISDETDILLDTGGGLLKAAEMLQGAEPILLHNVDVLSDIDLGALAAFHNETAALATLAVSHRKTSRYFLWDVGRLAGWENTTTGQMILCEPENGHHLTRRAFSGVHIIGSKLLRLITESGIFSINEVYLRLAKTHNIASFEHSAQNWADIGTPEKLEHARAVFEKHPDLF